MAVPPCRYRPEIARLLDREEQQAIDERNRSRRQPIQYESEVVTMADGEQSLMMHELPQPFRRSAVEQAIDALEHANLELEFLLDAAEQGDVRPAQLKRARRVRRHKLERAIRDLRVEAGWDQGAG